MSIEIDYYISKEDVKAGLLTRVSTIVGNTRRDLYAASYGNPLVDVEAMIRSSLAVCAKAYNISVAHFNKSNERMQVCDILGGKIAA
jgi:hypothetical protein